MMQSQLSAASYCRRNCQCVCHPLAAGEHGTADV